MATVTARGDHQMPRNYGPHTWYNRARQVTPYPSNLNLAHTWRNYE